MRARHVPASLVGVALLLTGCAPALSPAAAPSQSAIAESPTPTPTPAPPGELIIGIEGVTYTNDGEMTEFSYADDGEALVVLVEDLTGEEPQAEEIDLYGEPWGTRHTWDEVVVTVTTDGSASVSLLAPSVGDVPVETLEGLSVGSSRAAVIAAGGRDGWDADQDGIADYLDLGELKVADTQSLQRPGEVGIVFVTVQVDDGAVVRIQAPANDFSDI
ncbi:hypothetical protein ASD56_03440 [Microbacterium sp. Root166]|uniref:hypothetical protein n=1 Tax=Microbacterium sp. Root166 TaxID=1736478 RepID=UPI0006FA69F0|nr:hypothetical protein [Microbacterium sp. Root166]KQZ85406.1 hypothetical protein ASD56_03440 [Microbacterium sp. Root166]